MPLLEASTSRLDGEPESAWSQAPLVGLFWQSWVKTGRAMGCRLAGKHRKRTQGTLAKQWASSGALLGLAAPAFGRVASGEVLRWGDLGCQCLEPRSGPP
jgi:hypothetical protein